MVGWPCVWVVGWIRKIIMPVCGPSCKLRLTFQYGPSAIILHLKHGYLLVPLRCILRRIILAGAVFVIIIKFNMLSVSTRCTIN